MKTQPGTVSWDAVREVTSIGPHVDSQGAQAGEVRSQPPRGRREEKQLPGSEADGYMVWAGPPACVEVPAALMDSGVTRVS